MATAALPPLENLYRLNSKRAREIFASESEDTLAEDETRCVVGHRIIVLAKVNETAALGFVLLSKYTMNTATTKNFHQHYFPSKDR